MAGSAFTVGIAPQLATDVRAYFTKYRVLPPRNLVVGSTSTPPGVVCFETLLDAVIAVQDLSELVIVVHGHEDGSGLFLKLAKRGNAAVGERTTHDKLDLLMTIAARTPAGITAQDRQTLSLQDVEISRLIARMGSVQGKHLRAVEFRGCNLGRNVNSVERFRRFFGAASFGAPKLHSFFGLNPIGAGAGLMSGHTASHNGTTFTFTSTVPSGKTVHCCIGVNDQNKPQNGHVIGADRAAIQEWMRQNFDATATLGQAERELPLHGLWKFAEIDLNNPDPLPDTRPRPIFPLATDAQNRNEYALHIVYRP